MNRSYKILKTSSGPSTGNALFNHTTFSPSQTGETVPLMSASFLSENMIGVYFSQTPVPPVDASSSWHKRALKALAFMSASSEDRLEGPSPLLSS
jgi:hypothetical protein